MEIYCIANTKNNKVYIGQTILTTQRRWTGHKAESKKGNCRLLAKAIRKHKPDSFYPKRIAIASSREELDYLESYFIIIYNSDDPRYGYNLDTGGTNGRKHSEETKHKIGLKHKGKTISSEQRENQSNTMKGRIPWNLGKTYSFKPSYVPWNKGKSLSAEHKLKIKLAANSPEVKAKTSFTWIKSSKKCSI